MGAMALVRNLRNFDEAGVCGRGRGPGRGADQRPGGGRAVAAVPVPLPRRVPARALAALGVPAGAGARPLAGQRARAARPDAGPGRPFGLDVLLAAVRTARSSTGPTRRRSSVRRSRCGRRTRISSSSARAASGEVPHGRVRAEGARALRRPRRHRHHRGRPPPLPEARPGADRHRRAGRRTATTATRPSRSRPTCRSTPGTWPATGRATARPATANRHTFGGLSDAAFRMVPLLEGARDADWPWAAE